MHEYLSVGTVLYHKYLSKITVLEVDEDRIKADTVSRGELYFGLYDLGKVLFYEKSHSGKSFESLDKYLKFFEEEKRIRSEMEEREEQERYKVRIKQEREAKKKEN